MTTNQPAAQASTSDAKGAGVTPGTDPRTHPAVRKMLQSFGMADLAAGTDVKPEDGVDAMTAFVRGGEQAIEGLYAAVVGAAGTPEEGPEVKYTLEHAKNPDDGFEINMHIHRPADQGDKLLPAVLYIHGGGQMILHHYNALHKQWTHNLTRRGLVAINVGFRNGVDENGLHPFPTGLHDCVAAVRWVHENRKRLGISKIVVQGESGGGNLSVGTVLKLSRDGDVGIVDGLYSVIPYISGAYGKSEQWKREHDLNSLVDLDGYFLNSQTQNVFVALYDPTGKSIEDPLAWPWYATVEDFKGFPPTVVSVNELDALKDEGIHMARKMAEAGVQVYSRVNLGHLHGTDLFKAFVPAAYDSLQGDIARFTKSL